MLLEDTTMPPNAYAAAFISYSREDSEFALRLAHDLKAAGAAVWIDQIDIHAGEAWDNAIEDALIEAPRMILVLSPGAARSSNVRNEISFAMEQGKTVIPVLYRDCTVPLQLQRNHRIDFREDYGRALESLLQHMQIARSVRPVAHVEERHEDEKQVSAPAHSAVASPAQPIRRIPEEKKVAAAVKAPTASAAPAVAGMRARWGKRHAWWAAGVLLVLIAIALGAVEGWRVHERHWARWEAPGEIADLQAAKKPLAAFEELNRALSYLPDDATLKRVAAKTTAAISITSTPAGAMVEMQDYLVPDGPWHKLGVTPLKQVMVPRGYFRWKISAGGKSMIEAPTTDKEMDFDLADNLAAPPGMVYSDGGDWKEYVGFLGWVGPYTLPRYDIDRLEVTNAQYQAFVDAGGYGNVAYWPATFKENGRDVPWSEGVLAFRDTTGRPGPSTWVGGHFAPGKGDYPVGGVSWYEAGAYAAWAQKSLPVLSQWYQAAPPDVARYTVLESNFSNTGLTAAGSGKGVGPYGTEDMAGNVREWVANEADGGLRFILGGDWKSPVYLYSEPEAVSPLDRAEGNGFRCVKNLGAIPAAAAAPVQRILRDFSGFKTVPDDIFNAYKLLYAYPKTDLNVQSAGVVQETEDWREEKVTFDAAYGGQRMAAYLFLPKNAKPPYQTVLFFPSARIFGLTDSSHLGDLQFFDYIVQSGRAVMYPVYSGTYERKTGDLGDVELITEQYKDAARSLDYLATRPDIDSSRLAYLGVSNGSRLGVILTSLLQERLKTAVFLDGGYFLDKPQPGADPADFAVRMKDPVLMVNGRYDFSFPLDTAQNPLFNMLGTPAADKEHVVLDTSHDVTQNRPALTRAVLDWLDKYLGRVQ
jgi:formylglycine-generating enzyme required for sulfatase activity/dienelactone hydrolase